jgi:hypothetical protein
VTARLPSESIVKLQLKIGYRQESSGNKTHADPVHGVPSMTLQYDPPGRPVLNVVLHALSALLIATNPSEPAFSL